MGVYIKGMEMPKDCYDCPCHNGENGRCQITKEMTDDKRPYDCPLIEEKTGKWIPSVDRWGDIITTVDGYTCSECGAFNADKDNYCPNCGARMENKQ